MTDHRSGRGSAAAVPTGGPRGHTPPRVAELIVVRESDEHDRVLFDAMRMQTYAPLAHHSAIAPIIGLGLRPLTEGEARLTVERVDAFGIVHEDTIVIERLQSGRTWAILFGYGDVYHLWSMSSAAKRDADNLNGFTHIMCEAVQRLRPRVLRAATFSRLIRSTRQSNLLAAAMQGNVDRIEAGTVVFDLREDESMGWMLYGMFATISSMERTWINARLQAGKVAQWRRGEWPFGSGLVPFGYRYNRRSRRVEPDLTQREAVRQMLIVLASDLPPRAMVDALGELGVRMMRTEDGGRGRALISTAENPTMQIASLFAWIPVWVQGEYLLRVSNLHVGVGQVAGVPVARWETGTGSSDDTAPEQDPGELQLLFDVPVPPDGWAEPEVRHAAAAAATRFHEARLLRAQARLLTGSTEPLAVDRMGMRPLAAHVVEQSRGADLLAALLSPDGTRGNSAPARALRHRAHGRRRESLFAGRRWKSDGFEFTIGVREGGTYMVLRRPTPGATGAGAR